MREGKDDVRLQRLVEVGQKLSDKELEGQRQSCVVWLEKYNHCINLLITGQKGQNVVEVLLVFLNAPAIPNARGVNKVIPCSFCFKCVFLRKLGSRLTVYEFLICIFAKCNFRLFSLIICVNKSDILNGVNLHVY